jgi:hypothetical protein
VRFVARSSRRDGLLLQISELLEDPEREDFSISFSRSGESADAHLKRNYPSSR